MSVFQKFVDIIYPPRCHICQEFLWGKRAEKEQERLPFCQNCLEDFTEIESALCPFCGRPLPEEIQETRVCEDCLRRTPFFDRAGAPYLYHGSLMTAIHQFKYSGRRYLAKSLGFLLVAFAKEWLPGQNGLLTIPVPLHPKKLRERGFNQSLLLARHLTSCLNLDLDFLSLRRIKYTQPQTGLKMKERRKNVRWAFQVTDNLGVKGRNILLVDDVATTSSTLNECARVLKRAGAKGVYCIVLARTLLH